MFSTFMSSVRREPAGTGVTGEPGACDGVDDWRLAQQTVESCSGAQPVLQHRKRKPQQAPATLLRRMLIVTPHPHVHRSAHLLCKKQGWVLKGLSPVCHLPMFLWPLQRPLFHPPEMERGEKQKDHSHRPLWKQQGQFLSITLLGISNMGNENWKSNNATTASLNSCHRQGT